MTDDNEWGGKRIGAGHPENFDTQFVGEKFPHSIYCTDSEIDYLKFVLIQRRALAVLLNYEPVNGNDFLYSGTKEEWNADFQFLQDLNLWKVTDENYCQSQKIKIEKIMKKCLKQNKR